MRCARAKPKTSIMFNVQKQPVLVSGVALLTQKPHLYMRTESHQGGRKSAGVCLLVQHTLRRGGRVEMVLLICYSQHLHHHHLHLFCRLVHFQKILDQWRSLAFDRFVLNMIKGHHLQLRCHPLLFHNFTWFNIRVAVAHHAINQKEMDELLVKGSIE